VTRGRNSTEYSPSRTAVRVECLGDYGVSTLAVVGMCGGEEHVVVHGRIGGQIKHRLQTFVPEQLPRHGVKVERTYSRRLGSRRKRSSVCVMASWSGESRLFISVSSSEGVGDGISAIIPPRAR
jgi:hypothetical protein